MPLWPGARSEPPYGDHAASGELDDVAAVGMDGRDEAAKRGGQVVEDLGTLLLGQLQLDGAAVCLAMRQRL